jgi:hypothetical protein
VNVVTIVTAGKAVTIVTAVTAEKAVTIVTIVTAVFRLNLYIKRKVPA